MAKTFLNGRKNRVISVTYRKPALPIRRFVAAVGPPARAMENFSLTAPSHRSNIGHLTVPDRESGKSFPRRESNHVSYYYNNLLVSCCMRVSVSV